MKNIMTILKQKLKNPLYQFIGFGCLLLLIPLFSSFISVTILDAFAKTLIFFIVALGFALLIGYGGLASLGTSSFIAIGTFVTYAALDEFNLPFILTLVLGIVIALLVGSIFGIVSLRIEGMYLAIVTLGLSEIMIELFKNFDDYTGGVSGTTSSAIKLFGTSLNSNQTLILVIVSVVIAMLLTYNLINSPMGRALLSIKNNDSAAQAMGISVIKYRLLAFVVSTVYAVIGGILYMGYVRFSMGSTWGLAISLNILAAVVVGGAKSIWGVLLGTFMIFGLDLMVFKGIDFLKESKWANLSFVFSGLLIILVTMYYPNGLVGLINQIKFKLKKIKLERQAGKKS
ncbi:MAG: branched-chain amino acid ABC transporter permease [Paracholeplasma sp.]|nr:branched-chain amino acid ABC transporter permease [Paracholeplasma sp.]MDY3196670.1 branched-chain amino acid ABC transporter permease [Paracholeplasma sp.]